MKFWKLFFFCEMHHEKTFFLSWRKETAFFALFSVWNFFPLCTELFECAFNFTFCLNIFIFLNININQTSKEEELYKKQPFILWAAVYPAGIYLLKVTWRQWRHSGDFIVNFEHISQLSGSKLSSLQFYFTEVFEDYGHIFPTCSKNIY